MSVFEGLIYQFIKIKLINQTIILEMKVITLSPVGDFSVIIHISVVVTYLRVKEKRVKLDYR